jgi:transposase InsO family protein
MEEAFRADRAKLRQLLKEDPSWSVSHLMAATQRCRTWVKKWKKRFQVHGMEDDRVLAGYSHEPHHQPAPVNSELVTRILDIRDHPPAHLQRRPGPKAIQYFLQHGTTGPQTQLVPSTRTIWEVLRANGRIVKRAATQSHPVERPRPLQAWEIDFKDVSGVSIPDTQKRQHLLECLNVVDAGTSIAVDFRLHTDFNAQSVVEALVSVFRQHGLPESITLDRDVRFVGSWTARDFPSVCLRLLACLGVNAVICPPRTPQHKPFVERYNGTYERECLQVRRPTDLVQAQAVTAWFVQHYNSERPNQAWSCGNRPPRVAFPVLPPLRPLPDFIDPDAWLQRVAGRTYVRRINHNGTIKVDTHVYYIKRAFAGQQVSVSVDVANGDLVVQLHQTTVKRLPIRGLQRQLMPLEEFVTFMLAQAHSEWRRYLAHRFTLTRSA